MQTVTKGQDVNSGLMGAAVPADCSMGMLSGVFRALEILSIHPRLTFSVPAAPDNSDLKRSLTGIHQELNDNR